MGVADALLLFFFSVFPFLSLSLSLSSVGYGFCYIPSSSGVHDLEVDVWKPCGTPLEELMDFHLGGGPTLVDTDVIQSINKAKVRPLTGNPRCALCREAHTLVHSQSRMAHCRSVCVYMCLVCVCRRIAATCSHKASAACDCISR